MRVPVDLCVCVCLCVVPLQTLSLNPEVTLCDCPGLVFPSFVSSHAEMVTNGILPIAHLRDHTGPMQIVCTKIPRHVLADTYGTTAAAPYAPHSHAVVARHCNRLSMCRCCAYAVTLLRLEAAASVPDEVCATSSVLGCEFLPLLPAITMAMCVCVCVCS